MEVTSISKGTVRVYTDGREGEEIGHFLKCTDCGRLQLISKGKNVCGKCTSKKLVWVNDDKKEVTPKDLEEMGYDLEFVIIGYRWRS